MHLNLAVFASLNKTFTIDEPNHLRYGQQIIERNDFSRFDNSKMPISRVNASAMAAYRSLCNDNADRMVRLAARFPTMIMGSLIPVIVFFWVRRYHSSYTALLAMIIMVFEPSILAHMRFVTTDVPVTLFILLTGYMYFLFLKNPGCYRAIGTGAAAGLALISKYSAIPLVGLLLMHLMAVSVLPAGRKLRPAENPVPRRRAGLLIITIWFVIWCGYGFQGFGRTLDSVTWHTDFSQEHLTGSHVPALLPPAFLEGIDWCIHDDRQPVEVYFWGRKYDEPVLVYYPLVLLIKTPLPILILILLALIVDRRRLMRTAAAWIPAVGYFLSVVFALRSQMGVRFILPMYPLLIVAVCGSMSRSRQVVITVMRHFLIAWLIGSMLSFYPHLIPYCNELIGSRLNLYKYLGDSNNDWGQDGWYRDQYIRQTGVSVRLSPEQPAEGMVCVPISHLVGIFAPWERYQWVRECFTPVDSIGYSHLIYRVDPGLLLECLPPDRLRDLPRNSLPDNCSPGLNAFWYKGIAKSGQDRVERIDSWPRITGDSPTPESPFRVEFHGFLVIPESGNYLVCTESDDGSALYLQNQEIVSNTGSHPRRSVCRTVYLSRGIYPLKLTYDDRGGDRYLSVLFFMEDAAGRRVEPTVHAYNINGSNHSENVDSSRR